MASSTNNHQDAEVKPLPRQYRGMHKADDGELDLLNDMAHTYEVDRVRVHPLVVLPLVTSRFD